MREKDEIAIRKIIWKYSVPMMQQRKKMKAQDLVGLTLDEIMTVQEQHDMRVFGDKGLDLMVEELHKAICG